MGEPTPPPADRNAPQERVSAPPPSKTEYVVQQLREDIKNGRFQPGELLQQTAIAELYGVSPTPVREALRVLEAERAIQYSAHHGATVREMSLSDIEDYYRLRASVEGLAVEVAVERMTAENLERIVEINDRLAKLVEMGTQDGLSQLNMDFHFAIYESGSMVVANEARSLWQLIPPSITLWNDGENALALLADHYSLIDSLEKGDHEGAARHARQHIMRAADMRRIRSTRANPAQPSGGAES